MKIKFKKKMILHLNYLRLNLTGKVEAGKYFQN